MEKMSVDQSLKRAKSLINRGDRQAAKEVLKTILNVYPGNVRAQKMSKSGLQHSRNVHNNTSKQGGLPDKVNFEDGQFCELQRSANDLPKAPSQKDLKSLFISYQKAQFRDAEKLASAILKRYPLHQLTWKILGSTLEQIGKLNESLDASAKSVQLAPQDPEAHNNLGVTLHALGRFEEAKASYKRALALKSNFIETHINLGNSLKELCEFEEAKMHFVQAISLNPKNEKAHNNLGLILHEMGKLQEAVASFKQALILRPNYVTAHFNFGNTLKELGKLGEAKTSYLKVIELDPTNFGAQQNLSNLFHYCDDMKSEITSLKYIIKTDPSHHGLKAAVNLAICDFLEDHFQSSKTHLLAAKKIRDKSGTEFKNERVYLNYLSRILEWHQHKINQPYEKQSHNTLYVIGESHSLVSHSLCLPGTKERFRCKAMLIKGCMQWHVGSPNQNQYKYKFEQVFKSLPIASHVLVTIGEIDCRIDTGIMKYHAKNDKKDIKKIVNDTVTSFINCLSVNNLLMKHKIIIQGVPCPSFTKNKPVEKEPGQLAKLISQFNATLEKQAKRAEFDFMDVHAITDRGDGYSNGIWHIDSTHLSPDGFLEAWKMHISRGID